MPNTAAWVDTGFLVGLFARTDKHHRSAVEFLKQNGQLELHSTWPVVSEACFFLDSNAQQALLSWLEHGAMTVHELTIHDLPAIRATLKKYRNLEPDFADAALVTLAAAHDIEQIITVDVRDFSAYRLKNGKPFRRLWL